MEPQVPLLMEYVHSVRIYSVPEMQKLTYISPHSKNCLCHYLYMLFCFVKKNVMSCFVWPTVQNPVIQFTEKLKLANIHF